jgi:lipid-A-disaccharide synthase
LANLIARKRIVPELIQEDASAENIARTVLQVIKDASRYHEMSSDLLKVLELMGKAGAADRVARIAGDLMDTHLKNAR